MATPQDLPRQVNQNKNDIEALYKLGKETNDKVKVIAEVQQKHGQRLDTVDGRLDTIDGRLDTIDVRLDTMDGRLDTMDGRLGSIEATQGEHSGKLDEILGILKAP